jgi:hypothetical protein
VPTATFRVLSVFVVLSLDRRRIVHFNVTDSPTAEWTSLQLIQAFPFGTAPRYVIRDRDSIYGEKVVETLVPPRKTARPACVCRHPGNLARRGSLPRRIRPDQAQMLPR